MILISPSNLLSNWCEHHSKFWFIFFLGAHLSHNLSGMFQFACSRMATAKFHAGMPNVRITPTVPNCHKFPTYKHYKIALQPLPAGTYAVFFADWLLSQHTANDTRPQTGRPGSKRDKLRDRSSASQREQLSALPTEVLYNRPRGGAVRRLNGN